MDAYKNQSKVAHMCNIHRKKMKSVLDNQKNIRSADSPGTAIDVKLPLRARFPAVYNSVVDFTKFARSERLRVTSSHIKS